MLALPHKSRCSSMPYEKYASASIFKRSHVCLIIIVIVCAAQGTRVAGVCGFWLWVQDFCWQVCNVSDYNVISIFYAFTRDDKPFLRFTSFYKRVQVQTCTPFELWKSLVWSQNVDMQIKGVKLRRQVLFAVRIMHLLIEWRMKVVAHARRSAA